MRLWTLALVAMVAACGSDDGGSVPGSPAPTGMGGAGSGGAPSQSCVPGTTIACLGPGACQGAQPCKADGSGYEPCDCGGGSAGAGGASGGAGGAGGQGAGGKVCVALTVAQACSGKQCGAAADGCGGTLVCPACDPWLKCEAQASGVSICTGNCKPFNADLLDPDIKAKCLKQTQDKVQVQECGYDDTNKPDGCLITLNPGVPKDSVLCCAPKKLRANDQRAHTAWPGDLWRA